MCSSSRSDSGSCSGRWLSTTERSCSMMVLVKSPNVLSGSSCEWFRTMNTNNSVVFDVRGRVNCVMIVSRPVPISIFFRWMVNGTTRVYS